jgi:hypothetical protein
MLSYLLGIIQEFERNHGRRPQLVCLNPRHLQALQEECPGLFDGETPNPLGFHITVLAEAELPHPKAVWMPTRTRALQRTPRVSAALLTWLERRLQHVKRN